MRLNNTDGVERGIAEKEESERGYNIISKQTLVKRKQPAL